MAGELRLGESARILKNTRELLFSRTLSCSAPPPLPAPSISFFLSHFLIDCFKFLGPLLANWTHALHYFTLSKLILSEGKNLIVYMVFQNLVLFPDFPIGIQGSCLERPNILTSPINLLTLTVTDGTIMFDLQVMHSLILTQFRSSLFSWKIWQPLHHVLSGDFGRIVAQRDRVATIQESLVAIQQNRFHKIGHTIKYWYITQEMNHSLPFFCFVIQN